MGPALAVHGGAWAIPDELVAAHVDGVQSAMAAGWQLLERGARAVDVVEAVVAMLENDPAFDAGRGSFLNADGRVQLDAFIMDGATLEAGGVGCVERIRNPIRAAALVMRDSPHVYLVGEGAERFAADRGLVLCDNEELVIEREVERLRAFRSERAGQASLFARDEPQLKPRPIDSHDTVGAIALDIHDNLAAATSTGGTLDKAPGRIGDSSLIGCGCYADNLSAAAAATGWGEPIMKVVLAKWATDRVGAGTTPAQGASDAVAYLERRANGRGGILLLDRQGRYGIAHNTPRMAWGIRTLAEDRTGYVSS